MTSVFTEFRLFRNRIGGLRSILLHLALLAAFGVWIPRMKGLDFLDSEVLAAYACLGFIFAAPAAAQFFSGNSCSFQEAKARILVSVIYGELVVAALLGLGIGTVYATQRGGYIPTPDWETLAKSSAFGLGASAMLASMAAWVTVRYSRRMAMISLRLAFFGLLVLFFYKGRWLPDVGLEGAGVCIAVAGIFIVLLKKVCQ